MNASSRLNSVRVSSTGPAVDQEQVLVEVEPQAAGTSRMRGPPRASGRGGCGAAARSHGDDLTRIERLRNVVVRAQLQPYDLVRVLDPAVSMMIGSGRKDRVGAHHPGRRPSHRGRASSGRGRRGRAVRGAARGARSRRRLAVSTW